MNHFTDDNGYKAISSQLTWTFKASQPPGGRPYGAYFTTLPHDDWALSNKLRIPKVKLAFFFSFLDDGTLKPLRGGRGNFVFYATVDHHVPPPRQQNCGQRGTP